MGNSEKQAGKTVGKRKSRKVGKQESALGTKSFSERWKGNKVQHGYRIRMLRSI